VHQTAETILRLAQQGNVILIGRGANLVTRKLPHVLHVRLVGSLEKRVAHMQEIRKVGRKAALELIHTEDRGRQRYLKKYFDKNPDDPLLYNLVINTDSMSYEEAAYLIGNAALRRRNQQAEPAPSRWAAEMALAHAH
jgi:cytidylate kinase